MCSSPILGEFSENREIPFSEWGIQVYVYRGAPCLVQITQLEVHQAGCRSRLHGSHNTVRISTHFSLEANGSCGKEAIKPAPPRALTKKQKPQPGSMAAQIRRLKGAPRRALQGTDPPPCVRRRAPHRAPTVTWRGLHPLALQVSAGRCTRAGGSRDVTPRSRPAWRVQVS